MRFQPTLRTFARDERGTIAILFGFSVLVAGGAIALGLDYGRALGVKSRLQQAADAAALASKPDGSLTSQQMTDAVNKTFTLNTQGQTYGALNISAQSTPITNGMRVTATADVPTTFGRLLGVNKIPIKVIAEAVSGKGSFEIVLVLDTTYSMNGSKLASLQASAKNLIDLVVASSQPGSVKFGLVPFSQYVNVGMAYRNATWMSVPPDSHTTGNASYTTTDWPGCPTTTTTSTGTCYNDGVPFTCQSSTTTCQTPGPPVTVNYTFPIDTVWNGCAGSRQPAPDLSVSATMGGAIPGIMNVGCPSPLARLTSDASTIKAGIDAMVAQGETYIPAGLMWGWRVIAPDSPFGDGAPYTGAHTRKIIILMTDGFNTKSQFQTGHEGGDTAAADSALTQLCSQVRLQNIELYTIDFQVTNAAGKALMQSCATDIAHFFDAQDSNALDMAFKAIAGSLIKLALSK